MQAAESLSVRWMSSVEEIPSDLWARCFVPPLEGRWWYRALERSGLESQFTFSYAIIERGPEPVGIAPTFLMDVPIDLVAPPFIARLLRLAGGVIPHLRFQRTLFVGSPCSDEGTVGLLPGAPLAEVAPILHDALPLSRGGFDACLQTLTSSHRHNLRKKLRRSKELGDLQVTVLQCPDPPLLDEIFALFEQTYQKGKTKFERLTPRFFQLIAAEDVSHFILLRHPQTGRLVAFMLCFRIGSRVINKFIGLDYRLGGNWFLYFRLLEQAIDWASSIGAIDFQSGQTGYRAKLDLGHRLIPLNNYCQHRNFLLHRVYASIANGISWSTLDEDLAHHLIAQTDLVAGKKRPS